MKIQLINEVGLTESEMKIVIAGLIRHGNRVALAYDLPLVEIIPNGADKSLPAIYITERNRISAQGNRQVINGVPTSFVSRAGSGKLFGKYTKPWVLKGVVKTKARFLSGTITVLAHELSEMIVAPYLDQFTLPDSAGKSWRKEVCDPTLGAYYFANINGTDCVFPDFVFPSFWDANGVAPYSYLGTAKAPLVWASGSYAWFKTALTRLTRIQF